MHIEKIGAYQIGKTEEPDFAFWNLKVGAYYFCAFEHWEPEFLFSKEPDLLKSRSQIFLLKFEIRSQFFSYI